jgi:hypothetical protein
LFERAFEQYAGDQRREYQEMLDRSPGDSIDPYWSMREPGERNGQRCER